MKCVTIPKGGSWTSVSTELRQGVLSCETGKALLGNALTKLIWDRVKRFTDISKIALGSIDTTTAKLNDHAKKFEESGKTNGIGPCKGFEAYKRKSNYRGLELEFVVKAPSAYYKLQIALLCKTRAAKSCKLTFLACGD